MRILVANDDGISSPLLKLLAKSLKRFGEVLVCAPNIHRSATSQAIDFINHNKSDLEFVKEEDGISYYTHLSYPTDSLLYILDFHDFKPDLVVSGINIGINLSTDIYYSGTVGIATEAGLKGISNFAISISKDYQLKDLRFLDDIID